MRSYCWHSPLSTYEPKIRGYKRLCDVSTFRQSLRGVPVSDLKLPAEKAGLCAKFGFTSNHPCV